MDTQRNLPWNLIVIWLLASVLAVLLGGQLLHGAVWKGEYLPVGIDSFYHARRILDTVHDLTAFYEFDPKIHVPEGSLLTWPWGYDYGMALLVRAGLALGLSDDPMAIMIWIPLSTVAISIGLLIIIARQIDLGLGTIAIAALCISIAPTTQLLHAVGWIDHHYAEYIFILAALAGGLSWLRQPESRLRAVALAIVFGFAPAVQNGLFIIQLPLLLTLFALWLQGRSLPARSGLAFAIALVLATLAILIPSLPFRTGRFEFYTLSWFHLYIAVCTAVTVILLSRLKPVRSGIIALLTVSAVLLVPILKEIAVAHSFIAGTPEYLRLISEMKPPLTIAMAMGPAVIAGYYSHLIWVAPLSALICAYKCYQDRTSPRLLFWITSLMGLGLLFAQLRMQYFGNFALYLPWLVLLQSFCEKFPEHMKKAVLAATLATILLYYPALRHQLLAALATANDIGFRETRPVLATLSKACAEDPGVVLADTDVAHYIRYYTECSVIANNFLLTPQHFAKVDEVLTLFAQDASELAARAPNVKYVLVRPDAITMAKDGGLDYNFLAKRPTLPPQLLMRPLEHIPPEYTLLDEVRLPELNNAVYARLFKLRHDPPAATISAAPSANDVAE